MGRVVVRIVIRRMIDVVVARFEPDQGMRRVTLCKHSLRAKRGDGTINASVSRIFNRNFEVTSLLVNGGGISYSYDTDGLLTQAGEQTLIRDPINGLLLGTELGSLSTFQNYNDFAEVSNITASYNTSVLYNVVYSHDNLGRITQKMETLGKIRVE